LISLRRDQSEPAPRLAYQPQDACEALLRCPQCGTWFDRRRALAQAIARNGPMAQARVDKPR
jgi:hypothetical protein